MNRRHFLSLVACAALTACGGGGDSQASEQPLQVFIFAGQSNMLGSDALIAPTNGVQDLVDIQQQTDTDRASRLAFRSRLLSYDWGDIRGHNGYHIGMSSIDGKPVKVHGPEVGFDRRMGGNIYVIKYADNFTELENGRSPWVKGGSRWVAWQAFVDAQLASIGKPYVIAGFVWDQGIDDAMLIRDKAAYKADLQLVAHDLRAKFGNKPFILARVVDSPIAGEVAMAPIRDAQVEVGQEPGNAWINVDDLGPYVASHHMTSAAHLVSGKRFAEAYLNLAR